MNVKISISLEDEVFQHIEKMRGNKTQFRSQYINQALREKMGLAK
jgi:metal-responsive CopG/Arc/MetJ family transcriptional regulator